MFGFIRKLRYRCSQDHYQIFRAGYLACHFVRELEKLAPVEDKHQEIERRIGLAWRGYLRGGGGKS